MSLLRVQGNFMTIWDRIQRLTRPLASCVTSLLNRGEDWLWEQRLGIHTTRSAPSPHEDAHRYGYVAYDTYLRIFNALKLTASDVVVDLGCGKGRIVCTAACYPIAAALGVEIDPALYREAQVNIEQMRWARAPRRVECISATEFDYDEVTVAILFHPFGKETWRKVLDRIEASLVRNPRSFRIVYINPEYLDVLVERPWLKFEKQWTPGPWSRLKFPIVFYRALAGVVSDDSSRNTESDTIFANS